MAHVGTQYILGPKGAQVYTIKLHRPFGYVGLRLEGVDFRRT